MKRKIIPFPGSWEGSEPPPAPMEISCVSIHPDGDLRFIRKFKTLEVLHPEYQGPFSIPYVDLRALMNNNGETEDARHALAIAYFSSIKEYFKKFGDGEIRMFQYDILNDTWKDEHISLESNFDEFAEKVNLWSFFGYYRDGDSVCVAGFFGVDYDQRDTARIMQARSAISWFEEANRSLIVDLPKADFRALISHIHYQIDLQKIERDFDV